MSSLEKSSISIVQNNSGLHQYLRKVNEIASLSAEEELSLAKAYLEHEDIVAAQKLVTTHLKLVAKVAMRYRNYGLPVVDLISEGNLGLMQAVKKYNPDLGFRLSTYAIWWIKAAIQEYILRSWSLVKIGTTAAQKRLFFSLSRIKNKIANVLLRAPNEQDFPAIAAELGVSVKEVETMNSRLSGSDLSLHNSINNDDSKSELLEFLPDKSLTHDVVLMNREEATHKQRALSQAMTTLSDRELQILTERKLQESPTTLEALSARYNVSKERIRQIENRAFEKVQSFVLARYALLEEPAALN